MLYVVGDIHGDLLSFLIPLQFFINTATNDDFLIYLGDYIDRGKYGEYILRFIKYIKDETEYKNNIIFLIGNHEVNAYYEHKDDNIIYLLSKMGGCHKNSDNKFESKYFTLFFCYKFKDTNLIFTHDNLYFRGYPLHIETINDITFKANTAKKEINVIDKKYNKLLGHSIHGHSHGGTFENIIGNLKEIYKNNKYGLSVDLDTNQSYIYNKNYYIDSVFVILAEDSFNVVNCKQINKYDLNIFLYDSNMNKTNIYYSELRKPNYNSIYSPVFDTKFYNKTIIKSRIEPDYKYNEKEPSNLRYKNINIVPLNKDSLTNKLLNISLENNKETGGNNNETFNYCPLLSSNNQMFPYCLVFVVCIITISIAIILSNQNTEINNDCENRFIDYKARYYK